MILPVGAVLAVMALDRGRIYPNVFIAGRKVAGYRRHDDFRPLFLGSGIPLHGTLPITVRVGDESYHWPLRDTGISLRLERAIEQAYAVGRTGTLPEQFTARLATYWRRTEIAIPADIDARRLQTFVTGCARHFDHAPVNARAEVAGATVRINRGRPGVKLKTKEALATVRGWARGGCRGELRLPAQLSPQPVTAEDLKGIDTVLATVSTTLAGSSRNRRHNVALAASAVDGKVLAPGAMFSYNQTVGPRTEDHGYRTAPVIVGGKLVPGTGGGACQLSSTLYQVALRAGLEIKSRSHHSHPVAYTPAGFDATVVYGALDLKFRNNSGHPIMLWAQTRNGYLVCRALGHGPAPDIELKRQVRAIAPPEPELVPDATLAPGERKVETAARVGLRIRVLRKAKDAADNTAEVFTSYYAPQGAVILVGAPSPQPPPVAGTGEAAAPNASGHAPGAVPDAGAGAPAGGGGAADAEKNPAP